MMLSAIGEPPHDEPAERPTTSRMNRKVAVISKTARNALRAVLCIAEREACGPVSARAMAQELDLPRNYLSKTLYRLVRGGLLRATRGPGGGYLLAVPAVELPLSRIVEAIDPVGAERRCLLGRPVCAESNPCAMHGRWCVVREAIDRFFSETKVGDLLQPSAPDPRGHSSTGMY